MSEENKINKTAKVKNPFYKKDTITGVFINNLRPIRSFLKSYNRFSYMYVFSDYVQGIRICLIKIK